MSDCQLLNKDLLLGVGQSTTLKPEVGSAAFQISVATFRVTRCISKPNLLTSQFLSYCDSNSNWYCIVLPLAVPQGVPLNATQLSFHVPYPTFPAHLLRPSSSSEFRLAGGSCVDARGPGGGGPRCLAHGTMFWDTLWRRIMTEVDEITETTTLSARKKRITNSFHPPPHSFSIPAPLRFHERRRFAVSGKKRSPN